MSTEKNQSAIAEVRDQLSLDFADGARLNSISSNLGIDRPVWGFSDALWRALVKVLALQYKQIANKFREVLAILFGPRVTQAVNLAKPSLVGDKVIVLHDTSNLPQLGSLILDELLGTREEVTYDLIDRVTNEVFLNEPLVYAHRSYVQDADTVVVTHSGTSLVVVDSSKFPTDDYPYPVLFSAGTDQEEVLLVTLNDVANNTIQVLSALTSSPLRLGSTAVLAQVSRDYVPSSVFIQCLDIHQFPGSGLVYVESTSSFTASGVSGPTLSVPPNTFTPGALVGAKVVFLGDVTAAIAGVESTVIANSDDSLETESALAALGDSFVLKVLIPYEADYENNCLVFSVPLPTEVAITSGASVELVKPKQTLSLAGGLSHGSGWDVIQVTPRVVDLLIPDDMQDESNLRSASYLHTTNINPPPSTTITNIADDVVTLASDSGFPFVGVVTFGQGGPSEERRAYFSSGSNEITVVGDFQYTRSPGDTVDLWQPIFAGTDILVGDYNLEDDVFPGPYLYSPTEAAPTGAVGLSTLTATLPGPATIVMEQGIGRTALEIDDASSWDRTSFPYTAIAGVATGNRERVVVNDINFRSRALTTTASLVTSGSKEVPVTSLSNGGAGDAADFPNSNGYRVVIDQGTPDEEVVYVESTLTGPPRLVLQNLTTKSHSSGAAVSLMADVVSTNALTDDHNGLASYGMRSTAVAGQSASFPSLNHDIAETICPEVSQVQVQDASVFSATDGKVLLNFGYNKVFVESPATTMVTPGSTTITLSDGSGFPDTGEFFVLVNKGTRAQEKVAIAGRSGNVLHITFPTRFSHSIGTVVSFKPGSPEPVNYASITGNTLSLSPPIMLGSTHSVGEVVVDSSRDSDPSRDGFDFPFRMPPSFITRVRFIFDLIRAAGVQVNVISKR